MEGKTYTFDIVKLKQLPDDFIAIKLNEGLNKSRYGLIDIEYTQLMLIAPSVMEMWRDLNKKPSTITHYEPANGDIESKKWIYEFSEPYSNKGPLTSKAFERLLEIYRMDTAAEVEPEEVDQDPYQYENNYIQQLYDQYYSTEPQPDPKKIFVVKDDMPESLQKRIKEIVAKLSLKTKTSKIDGNDVIIDDSNFAQYVKRYTDLIRGAGKNTTIEGVRYTSVFGKLTENLNQILVEGMQEIKDIESAIDDAVEYRRLSPQNAQYWEQLKQYQVDVKKQEKQTSAQKIATPKPGNSNARYVFIPKHIANQIGYSTKGLLWGDRKYFVDRKISKPNRSYYIVTGDIGNGYKIDDVDYYASENKFSKANLPSGDHSTTDWGKVDNFMKSLSLGPFNGDNNNIYFMPGAAIPKPTVPELPPPLPLLAPGLKRPSAPAVKPQALGKTPAKPAVPKIEPKSWIKQRQPVQAPKPEVKVIRPRPLEFPDIRKELIPRPEVEPYKQAELPAAEEPRYAKLGQKPQPGIRPPYKSVEVEPLRRLPVEVPAEEPLPKLKLGDPEVRTRNKFLQQLRQVDMPPVDQAVTKPKTDYPITKGKAPSSTLPLRRQVQPPVGDLTSPPPPKPTPPSTVIPEPKVRQGGLADLDNSPIRTKLVGKSKIPPPKVPELKPIEPAAVGQRTISRRGSSAPVAKTLEQRARSRVNRALKKLRSFPAKVGQTLAEIAKLLNTDVKELAALNTNYSPAKGGPVLLSPQAASNADYVKLPKYTEIPEEAIDSLKQQAQSADELAARRAKYALKELEKIKITMETPSLAKAVGSNLDQYAKSITIIDQTLYNEINDIIRQGAAPGDYLPNTRPAAPSDYKKALKNTTGNDTLKKIKDSDIEKLEKFRTATTDNLELGPRHPTVKQKLPPIKDRLQKFGGRALRGMLGLWPQTVALELIFAQEAGTGEDYELRLNDIDQLVKDLQNPQTSKLEKIENIKKMFNVSTGRWANDEYLSGIADPPQPIIRVADNSDSVDFVTPYNADKLTVLDLLFGTYKKLDLETLIEETESHAGRWNMLLTATTTGGLGASGDKELEDMMLQAAKQSTNGLNTQQFMQDKIDQLQSTAKYLKTLLVHLPETRKEAAERYFTNAVMLDWIGTSEQEDAEQPPAEQTVDLKEETVTSLMDAIEKRDIKEIVKQLGKRAIEIYQGIPDATADTLQIDLKLGVGLKVYQEAANLLKKLYNEMAALPPDDSAKERLAELQDQIKETQGALSSVARYSNEQDAVYSLEDQKEIIEENLLIPINDDKTEFKFNKDLFPQYVDKLALQYGVPANGLYALSMCESSGGEKLYGDKGIGGSYGAFQVLSSDNGSFADYQLDLGVDIPKETLVANPILATEIGAWYYAKMYRQTQTESRNNNWTTPTKMKFTNDKIVELEGVPADLVRAAVRHNGGPSAISEKTGLPTKNNSGYAAKFVKYYKETIQESHAIEFKNSLQRKLFERLNKEKQCEIY